MKKKIEDTIEINITIGIITKGLKRNHEIDSCIGALTLKKAIRRGFLKESNPNESDAHWGTYYGLVFMDIDEIVVSAFDSKGNKCNLMGIRVPTTVTLKVTGNDARTHYIDSRQ